MEGGVRFGIIRWVSDFCNNYMMSQSVRASDTHGTSYRLRLRHNSDERTKSLTKTCEWPLELANVWATATI